MCLDFSSGKYDHYNYQLQNTKLNTALSWGLANLIWQHFGKVLLKVLKNPTSPLALPVGSALNIESFEKVMSCRCLNFQVFSFGLFINC